MVSETLSITRGEYPDSNSGKAYLKQVSISAGKVNKCVIIATRMINKEAVISKAAADGSWVRNALIGAANNRNEPILCAICSVQGKPLAQA